MSSGLKTVLAERDVGLESNGRYMPHKHLSARARKRVFFMRHGETEHNVLFHEGKWREAQDLRDPLLTAIGQKQAVEAASTPLLCSAMRSQAVLLVISPLRRAVETAMGALGHWLIERRSAGTPVRVELDPDIQECGAHKCNTGRPASELRMEFGQTSVGLSLPFDKLKERWFDRNGDGADSLDAIAIRLARFTHWIHLQPEPNIIVVSHQQILRHMLGVNFANCEVRLYTIDDSGELMSRISAGRTCAFDLPFTPPWSAVYPLELPLSSKLKCANSSCNFDVHTNRDFGNYCCRECAEDYIYAKLMA